MYQAQVSKLYCIKPHNSHKNPRREALLLTQLDSYENEVTENLNNFPQGQNLNAGGPPEPISSVTILGMHITNSRTDCISFTYLLLTSICRLNHDVSKTVPWSFTVNTKPNDFIQTMVLVTTYADSQNLFSGLVYSIAYLIYPWILDVPQALPTQYTYFPQNLFFLTLVTLSVKSP